MAKTTKIELTEKQERYLVKHFQNTKNAELAAKLGISETSLHRHARRLGLKKTRQFMTNCQRATADAAKRSHEKNGTYPPKGYIIPGSEKHRFKPGVTPVQRLGKRKEAKRVEKAAATRKKTWKQEHARYIWGLPQRTGLRVHKQPRAKICQRYYLKKRGYIVDDAAFTAYYTPATIRAPKLEAAPRKWYHFAPYNG